MRRCEGFNPSGVRERARDNERIDRRGMIPVPSAFILAIFHWHTTAWRFEIQGPVGWVSWIGINLKTFGGDDYVIAWCRPAW
jgi:hypothetical protein